jgi:hypothetical protein
LRYLPKGFIFDQSGDSMFAKNDVNLLYLLGFVNSVVALKTFEFIAPTLNLTAGNMNKLPVMYTPSQEIDNLVSICIFLSRTDWDAFETSWDFKRHPLTKSYGLNPQSGEVLEIPGYKNIGELEWVFDMWRRLCENRFNTLKANEEELNRIFIDIYGLQDELTPEVEDKDVTVRKADLTRDIKSFISYAVGCMFGRYSLDVEGLAFAGGDWDSTKYKTFIPDSDNVLPICDDEYFDDDIVENFVDFVKTIYGEGPLEENLRFIADALGDKGTPKEVIRKYFLNDFYKDHLKIYQKRPIYWLFDSGKKNGFKALVYLHRYKSDLLAKIRTDYVHEQQSRYHTALQHISDSLNSVSGNERVKLTKLQLKLQSQEQELFKFEEKIHHLADMNIKLDLDDGVKVNYAKFGDVLGKI